MKTKTRITTHPGVVLKKDFLEPLGITMNALAVALKVPNNRIVHIVYCQRSVSADTALRLSRFFGNSAQFWLNLQMNYDLSIAQQEHGEAIERGVLPREQNHISR